MKSPLLQPLSTKPEADPSVPDTGSIGHRIAFLDPGLPGGGSTTFLLNLVGELVRRRIPAKVFSSSEIHALAGDFDQRNIPVSLESRCGTIFEDRLQSCLAKLSRFAPTVVVANIGSDGGEILRYLPTGVLRVGLVHAVHQIEEAVRYAPTMDMVIAVSTYVSNLLANRPELSNLPVRAVESGVPIPELIPRDDLISGRPLRILYLGRLDEGAKRVRLFPTILKQLAVAKIPFSWTIAGEGPERQFLETEMVTPQPNQRVFFAGLVPYAGIPALLAEHDIVLLVSDSEVFPLSLHEGMAAGLVPVVSDLPGRVREIINPENGILVPPTEIEAYAAALVWLHEHREQMLKMSSQALATIGKVYSIKEMTNRWLKVLTSGKPKTIVWPKRFPHLTPLNAKHSVWFSSPIRGMRRWAVKIKWFLIKNLANQSCL